MKRLIAGKQFDQARAYMDHVVDQALTILKHRNVRFYHTPKLLEALAERKDLVKAGIMVYFVVVPPWINNMPAFVEEVCEGGQIGFVPTYGNNFMGLASIIPLGQRMIIL